MMKKALQAALETSALLKAKGHTVAVGESSAGGLIGAALLAQAGASAYFAGGGTVYTSAAKQKLLAMSDQTMAEARAATPSHALNLARSAQQRLGATWGVGETGAAGPTGNRYGDPAGHSCIAIWGPVNRTQILRTDSADRAENMDAFAAAALELLTAGLESLS